VRTELAGLEPTGRRFTVWVDVQNGARRSWFVGVEATRRDRDGHTIFMTGQGRDVRCALEHRIDYADDVVQVSVPRRCLDTPRVVRFRLLTEHVRRSWHYAWLDNGLAESVNDRHWTRWLSRRQGLPRAGTQIGTASGRGPASVGSAPSRVPSGAS
jgi:hypothetical protein